ncbi:Sigma-70 region 2 [Pirellula sp. SH-Sr6A]|uniref:sigma-70 family RNA polymerase sigma factor n=1 Tax=Pirellula sp. SH-Sr6A TaxID=1632865 RepID=UPI00078B27BF|nr:sigma-70 family RNA polymerase sigma factor [Pirellula sp. SH-Sr6A]AMV35216.1 Sigma-70 region 2 [Pirellula sp. SH-Sr6A]
MSAQPQDVLSDYARTLIRVKARQLVRRPEFTVCEAEDLEQELTLRILLQLDRFDPTRSSINTFFVRVVNSSVAMLIRERGRIKRNGGEGVEIESLEKMVEKADGSPAPLWTTISDQDAHRRHQSRPLSDSEAMQLRMDIASVLEQLPPDLRSICKQLLAGGHTDTRRDSQLSRRKYQAAMSLIREQFTRSGFSSE